MAWSCPSMGSNMQHAGRDGLLGLSNRVVLPGLFEERPKGGPDGVCGPDRCGRTALGRHTRIHSDLRIHVRASRFGIVRHRVYWTYNA